MTLTTEKKLKIKRLCMLISKEAFSRAKKEKPNLISDLDINHKAKYIAEACYEDIQNKEDVLFLFSELMEEYGLENISNSLEFETIVETTKNGILKMNELFFNDLKK